MGERIAASASPGPASLVLQRSPNSEIASASQDKDTNASFRLVAMTRLIVCHGYIRRRLDPPSR